MGGVRQCMQPGTGLSGSGRTVMAAILGDVNDAYEQDTRYRDGMR